MKKYQIVCLVYAIIVWVTIQNLYAQKVYYPFLNELPNNSPIKTKCLATRQAWFFKSKCQKSCEYLENILVQVYTNGTLPSMVMKPSIDSALAPFALAAYLQENPAICNAIKNLTKEVYCQAELRNFVAYAIFLRETHNAEQEQDS